MRLSHLTNAGRGPDTVNFGPRTTIRKDRTGPIVGRIVTSFLTILPEAKAPHERDGWTRPDTENPSWQPSISWCRTYAVLEFDGRTSFDFWPLLLSAPFFPRSNHDPNCNHYSTTRSEPNECESNADGDEHNPAG